MAWSVLAGSTDGGGKRRLLTDWLCPLSLSLSLSLSWLRSTLRLTRLDCPHRPTTDYTTGHHTLPVRLRLRLHWDGGDNRFVTVYNETEHTITLPHQSFIFSAPLQSKASGLKTLFRTKLVSVGEIVGPSILLELFVLVHIVGLRSDNLSCCTITHNAYFK